MDEETTGRRCPSSISKETAASISVPTPMEIPRRRRLMGQPNSLNDLIRRHDRQRLFIQPLHWTPTHLELLECKFCRHYPSRRRPTHDLNQEKDLTVQRQMLYNLGRRKWLIGKRDCVRRLMREYCIGFLGDKIPLYFAHTSVSRLCCDILFSRPTTRPRIHKHQPVPVFAYLDVVTIADYRKQSLLPVNTSIPNWGIHDRRLAHIQPSDPQRDPYIVAVLLALAQNAWRAASANGEPVPSKVYLLLTNHNDKRVLCLFTADIPSAYLAKFDNPACFSDCPLIIRYVKCRFDKTEDILAEFANATAEFDNVLDLLPSPPLSSPFPDNEMKGTRLSSKKDDYDKEKG